MTKSELIAIVAEENDITKVVAKTYVECVFDIIAETLANGENVSLAGFGNFKVVERNARTCRNPKTGEAVEVDASHAIKFTATKSLKDAVKDI